MTHPIGVGVFTALGSVTVPSGTNLIRTSGYNTPGLGSAIYVEVSSGPATRYRREDASNRWFELAEEVVIPTMLGALGDGSSDDTTAVQTALDLGRPIDLAGLTFAATGVSTAANPIRMSKGGLKLRGGSAAGAVLFTATAPQLVGDFHEVTFDGNHQGQTSGYAAHTVLLADVEDVMVTACRFPNGAGGVLTANNIRTRFVVERCLFDEGKQHGGELNDNTVYLVGSIADDLEPSQPKHVVISNNTFIGIIPTIDPGRGVGGLLFRGNSAVTPIEAHKLTVTDNLFYDCGQDASSNKVAAISLYRGCSFSNIANNKVFFGCEKGIDVQGSDHVCVVGNLIFQTEKDGIAFAPRDKNIVCCKVVVAENIIAEVGGIGISAYGIEADPVIPIKELPGKGIIITGNLVDGCCRSLHVTDYIGDINIAENVFSRASGPLGGVARDVVVLSHRVGTEPTECSLSFSGNQISDSVNSTYIRGIGRSTVISGNAWHGISPDSGVAALVVKASASTGPISITGNT